MPWPRIRFTAAILACVIVGLLEGAVRLTLTTSPRLEQWLARRR